MANEHGGRSGDWGGRHGWATAHECGSMLHGGSLQKIGLRSRKDRLQNDPFADHSQEWYCGERPAFFHEKAVKLCTDKNSTCLPRRGRPLGHSSIGVSQPMIFTPLPSRLLRQVRQSHSFRLAAHIICIGPPAPYSHQRGLTPKKTRGQPEAISIIPMGLLFSIDSFLLPDRPGQFGQFPGGRHRRSFRTSSILDPVVVLAQKA